MKKKLLILMLALVMVFSFSVCALAADKVFTVSVNGEEAVSYTLDELRALGADTVSYFSINSFGTQETTEFTGVMLAKIVDSLNISGTIDSFVFTATDNYKVTKAGDFLTADYLGEGPMIAINSDNTLQLVIAQKTADEINKSSWVRMLAKLDIKTSGSTEPPVVVAPAPTPQHQKAVVSSQKLSVNGEIISCTAYNIDGYNYFMLRDIALALKDTAAKFSVSYDEDLRVISAFSGQYYVANGNEWQTGADNSASCVPSTQGALFNGVASAAYCYNIAGSNYFQLRGLGEAFGFSVEYDDATRTMLVTTSDYTPEEEPAAGDVVVTINGVGYTYAQLAAAGAEELQYLNKKGDHNCLGVKLGDLVGEIPADATVTVTYSAGSGYSPDTMTGAAAAAALLLYYDNGAPIADTDKGGGTTYVRLYTTKGLDNVVSIDW